MYSLVFVVLVLTISGTGIAGHCGQGTHLLSVHAETQRPLRVSTFPFIFFSFYCLLLFMDTFSKVNLPNGSPSKRKLNSPTKPAKKRSRPPLFAISKG